MLLNIRPGYRAITRLRHAAVIAAAEIEIVIVMEIETGMLAEGTETEMTAIAEIAAEIVPVTGIGIGIGGAAQVLDVTGSSFFPLFSFDKNVCVCVCVCVCM